MTNLNLLKCHKYYNLQRLVESILEILDSQSMYAVLGAGHCNLPVDTKRKQKTGKEEVKKDGKKNNKMEEVKMK